MIKDILVGFEDAAGKPVVAYELPDVLDRVQLRRSWWQWLESNVVGDFQVFGAMPSGLIENYDGVAPLFDGP